MSVCVFCGSSNNVSEAYLREARSLGNLIAEKNLRLVYGGGSLGMMGQVAAGVLERGGKVLGIMPTPLAPVSGAANGDTVFVPDMHSRKALMNKESDYFIALPGGFGTLEEMFEMITWAQLGVHRKPIGVLNVNQFFTPIVDTWLNHAIEKGFVASPLRNLIVVRDTPKNLLEAVIVHRLPEETLALAWHPPANMNADSVI